VRKQPPRNVVTTKLKIGKMNATGFVEPVVTPEISHTSSEHLLNVDLYASQLFVTPTTAPGPNIEELLVGNSNYEKIEPQTNTFKMII